MTEKLKLSDIEKIIKDEVKEKPNGWVMTRGYARKLFREQYGVYDPWENHGIAWVAMQRKLGMTKTRAENRLVNQSTRHREVKKLATQSDDRLSWGELYTKKKSNSQFKTMVVASDFHDIECDAFALRMFYTKISAMQPDIIVINGDLFDLPEFGKYSNDPREYQMSKRIDWVHQFLAKVRELCPKSQIDFIEGNHEARLVKYLSEMTPMMADILDYVHGMDNIREVFGLDQYHVNYVAKGNLATFTDAQLRKEVLGSEKVYYDMVHVRHIKPTESSICMFGISGHHHKLTVSSYWNAIAGSFQWIENGGMHLAHASFTNGDMWNLGFSTLLLDTEKKQTVWDYTQVGRDYCVMDGVVFKRKQSEYRPFMLAKRSQG